jgi:5'-deoxynucleotidase YfbR-like HD superfamily hydrolase
MKFFKFMKNVQDLSTVKRFSQSTMCVPESVLEHSASASLFALFIGEGLAEEGNVVDFGSLLKKAIIHDFDEIATGDVARPVKYHSNQMRKEFKDLEIENMLKITKGSPVFFNNWLSAKEGKEGSIVSLCDFICVIYKLHDEVVMRGNKTMMRYFEHDYFSKLNSMFVHVSVAFGLEEQSQFLFETQEQITAILLEIKNAN